MVETAASLAAVALGTVLPVGSVAKLVSELALAEPDEAQRWEARFTAAVAQWIERHEALVTSTGAGAFDGWPSRLLSEFDALGADAFAASAEQARAQAVDVIAHAVFVPPTMHGWPAARAAAEALLDDLPELLVQAAGENAEYFALRTILGGEISQVLAAVDRLADRLPVGVADNLAIETYLTALCAVLDPDPWAQLLGGPGQSLQAAFKRRTVRARAAGTVIGADAMADACERLLILGEPGMGKSWLARHLAMRAARQALQALAVGDDVELPLFARASSVLDVDCEKAPWDVVAESAVGAVGDHVGRDGAHTLLARLDRHQGRYLVILDGLDEAVRRADADRLDRLTRTPGRKLRFVVTSRPGAWRLQLPLDQARPEFQLDKPGSGHAVVDLEPFNYHEILQTVAHFLQDHDQARAILLERLRTDRRLVKLSQTPLACVMVCAAVLATGDVPRGHARLVAAVLTLLLRSTWRQEASDQASLRARELLRHAADKAAVDDPSNDMGRWERTVIMHTPATVDRQTLACIDTVAPPTTFDPLAPTQARRFLHESLHEQLVAEHIATLSIDEAAARLRDHLWFEIDWFDAVRRAFVLHPARSAVLARVLDAGDAPTWDDICRLDGFLELRRHLLSLASETDAADWDEACRALIARHAHDYLSRFPASALRLELVRGGWPDPSTRSGHLAAIAAGEPLWPLDDLAEGARSLRLTRNERADLIASLSDVLITGTPKQSPFAAHLLDVLCNDEFAEERARCAHTLVSAIEQVPVWWWIEGMLIIGASASQRRQAAEATLAWLLAVKPQAAEASYAPIAIEQLCRLTDDPAVIGRDELHEKLLELLTHGAVTGDLDDYAAVLTVARTRPATCLAAIDRVLSAFEHAASPSAVDLKALLRRLVPEQPDQASAVAATLLQRPVTSWPSKAFGNFQHSVCLLLDAAGPDATAGQIAALVERLSSEDPPALRRLAVMVRVLGAAPDTIRRATQVVLGRVAETPPADVAAFAVALRVLAPAPGDDTTECSAALLWQAAEKASESEVRFALACDALSFAPTPPVREQAFGELVRQIATGQSLAVDRFLSALEDIGTPAHRTLAFEALLRLLGTRAVPSAAYALPNLAQTSGQRQRAISVLMRRCRDGAARYRALWLLPAARLGLDGAEANEANERVVEALPEIELDPDDLKAMTFLWKQLALTRSQRPRAARALLARLATLDLSSAEEACALIASLDPTLIPRAKQILRTRPTNEADVHLRYRALKALDPGCVDPEERRAGLARLRLRFDVDAAARLVDDGIDVEQREELHRAAGRPRDERPRPVRAAGSHPAARRRPGRGHRTSTLGGAIADACDTPRGSIGAQPVHRRAVARVPESRPWRYPATAFGGPRHCACRGLSDATCTAAPAGASAA